jgi:hypothetical protein
MQASENPGWRARLRADRRERRRAKSRAKGADTERSDDIKALVALVERLEGAAALLARSEDVTNAARAFDAAKGRVEKEAAATSLTKRAELVEKLLDAADGIDPHVIDRNELDRLWGLTPEELADEAIMQGAFRERRLILQAKGEQTNRYLARVAALAAVAALLVPVVDQAAQKWL